MCPVDARWCCRDFVLGDRPATGELPLSIHWSHTDLPEFYFALKEYVQTYIALVLDALCEEQYLLMKFGKTE